MNRTASHRVLAVVEDEHAPHRCETSDHGSPGLVGAGAARADGIADGGHHAHLGGLAQVGEPDAVRPAPRRTEAPFGDEASLPDPTQAHDRRRPPGADCVVEGSKGLVAADERAAAAHEVVTVGRHRPQRRKPLAALRVLRLEQVDGIVEVAHAEPTETGEVDIVETSGGLDDVG
jgi:hypothetical protein